MLPSGTAQLLVNVAADRLTFHRASGRGQQLPGVAVSGPFSRPLLVETEEQQHVVGASFRPGGLAAFLPLPVSVLHDEMVGLVELAPTDPPPAFDELREASDPASQLAARGHVAADPVR